MIRKYLYIPHMVNAAGALVLEHPWRFFGNIATLLSANEINALMGKLSNRGFWALVRRGQLTDAVELLRSRASWSFASRLYYHFYADKMEELGRPIARGERYSSEPVASDPRPLFVLTNSLPHTQSGYTVRSHQLLRTLKASGVSVSAVTRVGYPVVVGKLPGGPREAVDGIPYFRILPFSLPFLESRRREYYVRGIVTVAKAVGANILHTTTDFKNAQAVAEAAGVLGIPWVYEFRGEPQSTWLSRFDASEQNEMKDSTYYKAATSRELESAQAADAVLTLSDTYKKILSSEARIDTEKIIVVPNSVDEEFLEKKFDKRAIRSELGLENFQYVGAVSSIVDYEGFDVLIRSVVRLPDHWKVLLVGDGVARSSLIKLADELGVRERLVMVGRKPNKDSWKWYAALDVFAMPRRDQQVTRRVTPIKGLMAQALGIPVVASCLPALVEITGGHANYFVAGDEEGLARAILQAAEEDHTFVDRAWMSQYTWSGNGQKLIELYRYLLSSRKSSNTRGLSDDDSLGDASQDGWN